MTATRSTYGVRSASTADSILPPVRGFHSLQSGEATAVPRFGAGALYG